MNKIDDILGQQDIPVDAGMINNEQKRELIQALCGVLDEKVEGDVVELGCYVGESSKCLRRTLNAYTSDKQLYVYDSFEGLPPLHECEKDCGWRAGTLKTTKEVLIKNFIVNQLAPPIITKGWFKDITRLPDKICFAFLDGDFYDSIFDSLQKIYSKMSEGGVILFHDYARPDLPGVEKAVTDFRNINNISYKPVKLTEQLWGIEIGNRKIKKDMLNPKLTVVTGLWDINRPGRDFNHYIENFNKLLDIDVNLFVYVPASLEHLVWAKRKKENTFVKVYELDDVKNLYSPFWDKTQKIRTDPNWFNQTGTGGWLSNSPQAVCEWYNPIVMSKMFMLHDVTIWDPFASKHFIWLDAGITNTVYEKYFTENKVLDNIGSLLDPFLFLCYPYHTNNEIHGFKKDAIDKFAQADVQLVGRGGLFGGTKQAIHEANGLYYALVDRSLSEGYMGTEESIFSIMTYLYPETYRRYMLDENGLIIKFIQELADKKPALEPIPEERTTNRHTDVDLTKVKTAIYILTFNFPQQLRTLLKSLEKYPEWLQGTEKILIDNSTDPIAKAENQKIAQEYQFIHYKHFDNIGICGGRQYAAEHFDTTDNDFYVFFEDDMCLHEPGSGTCRNGFRFHVPNLFEKIQKIMLKEKFDFLKLSFTEVYMDNHIQCSWYNVPQSVRTQIWPSYDKLPVNGLDPNTPRTEFNKINVYEELAYIEGDVYYANWPLITSKEGNRKMFLNTKWAHPYEQTWMSHMFQETRKGNMKTAVLLASPINHNRIVWYKPHERKEN